LFFYQYVKYFLIFIVNSGIKIIKLYGDKK
jgi:hypothetical protein